jgi:hypothetical protein
MRIEPRLEAGSTKVTVTVETPLISWSYSETGMPTLHIEEGAVSVDLEFPAVDCIKRLVRKMAALRVPEPSADGG